MPEISVDSARTPHGYGVQAEQILWCSQGVLSVKQLKESEDEQFISDIIASVLLGEPIASSKELLDKFYDLTAEEAQDIQRRLVAYGPQRLESEIKSTFSILKQVIEDCSAGESNFLRTVVRPGTRYPIKTPFYTIFMAFFDLIVTQKKSPDQPAKIIGALTNLDDKLVKGTHYETTENREKNVNLTKGLIQDYFVDKVPPVLGHGPSLVIDFENALRRSRIETSRYEFKQGILRLDSKREIDNDLLVRLPETACGIANLGPEGNGNIFIGVADREPHANRIKELDGIVARKIADQFLVGIEREAKLLNTSIDNYIKIVVTAFQKSEISEPLKTQLLASFDIITIHGLTIIWLRIPPQRDVTFVGKKAFYREGSSTIEIEGPKLLAISKLFHK